jgi:DNA-directed RNA polymerase specialized sigma24 family protein
MRARTTTPVRITLDEAYDLPGHTVPQLSALDAALTRLSSESQPLGQVALLRFYGGLIVEEIAEVLGEKPAEVERRWGEAKRWLTERGDGRPVSGERPAHLLQVQSASCVPP